MMDEAKKIKDNIVEVVNERFFSPMYFYFIIAWLITNWKFVYVLLFANETLTIQGVEISKLDFLVTIYPFDTFWGSVISIIYLLVIPVASSWLAVWVLTGFSEKFFKKYETYQQNKRVIQRELEYTEKVRFSKMEREVRDAESDRKEINYDENSQFNDYIDDRQDLVDIDGIKFKPSEVLYNNDFNAYKELLIEWRQMPILDRLSINDRQSVLDEEAESEAAADLAADMYSDQMRGK